MDIFIGTIRSGTNSNKLFKMNRLNKKEIKKILINHELWLNNSGGYRADLSELDLSELDFSGKNLQEANLAKCDLSRCNCTYTNFSGTNLLACKFIGAVMTKTNMRCSILCFADFLDATMVDVDISFADLTDVNNLHLT